jgi:hypothetical protein
MRMRENEREELISRKKKKKKPPQELRGIKKYLNKSSKS